MAFLNAWCTIRDVFDKAPELENEQELGTFQPEDLDRFIAEGTQRTLNDISGRYDHNTIVGATISTIPTVLRNMASLHTAILILIRYQLGSADARVGSLQKSLDLYIQLAYNGSLRGDDGEILTKALAGGPVNSTVTPDSPNTKDIFLPGSTRLGVQDVELHPVPESERVPA